MKSDSHSSHCFHCGLPVDASNPEKLEIHGEEKHFCCHGCKAVCKTIIDAGLEKYYQSRDLGVNSNQQQNIQALLDKLSIYDNKSVQKSFVHGKDNWQEAYLILEGIRCSACVWLNELHLRQQAGVLDVHIDDITQRARVRWDPEKIALSQILATIVSIGYEAHPYEPSHYLELQKENKRKNLQRIFYTAIIGMIPMHFAVATWFIGGPNDHGQFENWEINGRWVSMLVTLTILVYPAQEFFFGVWSDLKRRVIGMDVPIVLGLSSAYLLSVQSTISGSGEVYYESIIMFVLFILLARRLEQQARVRASDQLERLALAQPVDANIVKPDGRIKLVSVLDLSPGDTIQILAGQHIPVDCEIIEGQSSFNESLITGESRAIDHGPGDTLMAGSVNYDQPVMASVISSEMESTIAEITRLAESGLENKPVQSLITDKVAVRFVLFILLISFMTALFWLFQGNSDWLVITVSVLIVTCPCALALAVPIALTLSASRYLKNGVLAMNMSILNKVKAIDLFVFDKTGTLTRGKPELIETLWLKDVARKDVLSTLNGLLAHSEHPIAKSLYNREAGQPRKLENIKNIVGQGIQGTVITDSKTEVWRFGRYDYVAEFIVDIEPWQQEKISQAKAGNYSFSCLLAGNQVLAIFLFEDSLRKDSRQTIKQLIEMGIKPVILSGDTVKTVSSVATELGIDEYAANMSPQQKMNWVVDQQSRGKTVAMVGDGINDAPTLACADVSFSLSDSTALANNHSDFLLLAANLKSIPQSIALAGKTLKLIKQNIGWAIFYNLIAIPFAIAGWVPPWVAAIGMSASSVMVVLNSMRLSRIKLQKS
ncbi:MAG: heavy metal translocating P-type ATPase [Gammaproteobacteria bacterium]|nr:heavy metal translocating P-type ATPase [Gammaproteobacteria bacterium]